MADVTQLDVLRVIQGEKMTDMECLYKASFDELVEIRLNEDRVRSIYHVEGKYFVPLQTGTYRDLYHYCTEHMIHPEDRKAYTDLMDTDTLLKRLAASERPGILSGRFRYRLESGGWRWVEQVVVGGKEHGLEDGVVRFFVFDIQNAKYRELGINTLLENGQDDRDPRTGLLREKAFYSAVQRLLEKGVSNYCFITLDIEHFKLFNDWFGRDAGNLLLAEIGAFLRREKDILAGYLSQDDFCAVMPYDMDRIEAIYQHVHGLEVQKGCAYGFLPAIGVCKVEENLSVLDLLDRAEVAQVHAKKIMHERIRLFESSMLERADQEYRLLMDFQTGIRNGEFFFELQPQCRISTHQIVGAESLVRWRRGEKIISPTVFVPVLEKYGVIAELDQYIWEEVCRWIRKWLDAGHAVIPISVNVSRVDIVTTDVPAIFESLTETYRLPHSAIKVEITESAVDNTAKVRETIIKLRSMGFMVLMDDFGSGYSSLNMLRKLSVDVLKLDAQFLRIDDKSEEERGIRIVESVVNMAKTMAIPIIVEGVETAAQTRFLHGLGCRYIQGFHFYRPMSAADFEKLALIKGNVDYQGIIFKRNQQFGVREFLNQNLYSDTMLNNVLGGVGIYLRHGDSGEHIDIIRYNEQFYDLVDEPEFFERLMKIERFIHPESREAFYGIFNGAEADRMNGSSGMVWVERENGEFGHYLMNVYYLETTDDGKKFYGSLKDMTQHTRLQNQMKLLCRFTSDSIVFRRRNKDGIRYEVIAHGLEKILGLSREDFERELGSGAFAERIAEQEEARRIFSDPEEDGMGMKRSVHIRTGGKEARQVDIELNAAKDAFSDVDQILVFRSAEG
ncbi:MAG: EAL domain-containing protein [Lachnospiraceae bacterium]|nr:EAL domain-containing protein [Lachnospiraceae bacterium]